MTSPVTPGDLGELLDLGERVLPDRGVEHEQHRVGRGRVELLQHPDDLVQLVHQPGLVLQAAGGVDEQHVDRLCPCRGQRLISEARGIGALDAGDHRAFGARTPDLELLDRRGAEGVAGREHDAAALAREPRGELADGRRLAGAVDAGDEDHERLRRRIDRQRLRDGLEDLLDLGGEDRLDLVGADILVVAALADRFGDPGRRGDAEVGADQHVLELFEHARIELALGDEVGDRGRDRGGGAGEPAAQPPPPAWPRFAAFGDAGFGDAVIHAGRRDTRFVMPIKDMSPQEMRPEQMRPEQMRPEPATPEAMTPEMTPEAILGRVLHRDGLMLVLDKPAGLPVHRGPKGGGSLEDWFDHLRYGLPRAPALAHRLDKDTSGCLVLGRHRKALAHLGLLFKHGKVGKTYWAVVEGGPDKEEGVIDLALARLDESRGWWMKPDPKGLPSVTTWKVLGRSGHAGRSGSGSGVGGSGDAAATSPTSPLTWLALTPVTGRTHQLRVHCAAMGWPILGDNIYGNGTAVRRAGDASPCPRDHGAALQEQAAGAGGRAGARAHAATARGMRMDGRGRRPRLCSRPRPDRHRPAPSGSAQQEPAIERLERSRVHRKERLEGLDIGVGDCNRLLENVPVDDL